MYVKKKGFTLLETLLVLAILLSATVAVIPISIRQLQKIRSSSKAKELSSQIFSVQQDSLSGLSDKTYGVAFYANNYILFTGNSLAASDSTINFQLPANISLSNINFGGSNELVFSKGSFRPISDGSFQVNDGTSAFSIFINREGAIWYVRN